VGDQPAHPDARWDDDGWQRRAAIQAMQENSAASVVCNGLTGARSHQLMQSHCIGGLKREDLTAHEPKCAARRKESFSSLVDEQRPDLGVKQDHSLIKVIQDFSKAATLAFQKAHLQADRHGALKMGSEQAAKLDLILLKLLRAVHSDHDPLIGAA
jgi:hypothetical protein